MNKLLQGKNIKLRAVEPIDADLLFKWENDFELWKVSNTLKPFSKKIINEYVENDSLDIYQTKQLRLMICKTEDEQTIGMIDLFDYDIYNSRAGIGILINKNFRNMGFASEALEILCRYSFDFLNIHQLYCDIHENNTASISLFEKAGFEKKCLKKDWAFNGKNFENVYFFQKIKG